jgi:hypothetical protein
MLKPANLTTAEYPLALSPSQGYEQQLYVSTEACSNPGKFTMVGVNSGVAAMNSGDLAQLNGTPQRLLAMLDTDGGGTGPLVLTVAGTDQDGSPLSGSATFSPPAWGNDQTYGFPKGWAEEIAATVGKYFKTITNISVVADVGWTNVRLQLFGVPDPAVAGKYVLVGCKTQLNYDMKVPVPFPIQCGRDKGAFIKQGDIPVGAAEITTKIPDGTSGIARYNGRAVTGLIKELKNDRLNTQNIYLPGLVITCKANVGEGEEPNTLSGTALYEEFAFILAK